MTRILLIAPKCYPVSGAESIVNIKMLKAFGKEGEITVDVISKKVKNANYPDANIDVMSLPIKELDVIEVDNEINIITIWQHFICLLKFGICTKGCHWALPALYEAIRKIMRNKYDYVLTKSGPSELVGYYLKKHYGMKWVATWNDPYPITLGPNPYGKGLNTSRTWVEKRMIKIMNQADIHIFPSTRLRDYMLKYLTISPEQMRIIPHVLLTNLDYRHVSYNDELKLIHSGNLGYPRDARTFFEGFRLFLDKNSNAKISFTILGNSSPKLNQDIETLNLSDYIIYKQPVVYNDSLALLHEFHVAVIIEANCKEGIYLPTKVSDYMQEGVPIFSVSPKEGTLKDLYLEKSIPYFAEVDNPGMICEQIEKIWSDFKNHCIGSNSIPPKTFYPDYIANTYRKL